MMSQRSRRELLEELRPRYLKARKTEKKSILDELVAVTHYHRKYAMRLLRHGRPRRSSKKHGLAKVYQGEVVVALEQIWEVCGRICSKRLQPFLPEMVKVLERCGELHLSEPTRALLLRMSRSTMDRCLAPLRFEHPHGLSTTKPGSLLKKAIPVRTYTPWDEDWPGFLEIDLVAHCGNTTEGQYLNTLTCTDLSTGWTEVTGMLHRSQEAVWEAIQQMRQRLPSPLLGIDSDNGGEFINDLLYRYCLDEHITFTRSRPYQKNDQAHVEQKNWSVVRHTVGYDRWETEQELALLESIYDDLRLYLNFFQPSFKLLAKQRIGKRTIKRYDPAKTPYQRVLERNEVSLQAKAQLTNRYLQLNPAALRTVIDQKVAKLWKLSR